MSVNRYKKYLIVLFEDRAYKDLFLGFNFSRKQQIRQEPILQGFDDVYFRLTNHKSLILQELKKYQTAYVLACIDADLDSQSESKIHQLKNAILDEYKERVFIIGSKKEAEHIKQAIIGQGPWATVSEKLENSCKNDQCELWQNEMLQHNLEELQRLKQVFDGWE